MNTHDLTHYVLPIISQPPYSSLLPLYHHPRHRVRVLLIPIWLMMKWIPCRLSLSSLLSHDWQRKELSCSCTEYGIKRWCVPCGLHCIVITISVVTEQTESCHIIHLIPSPRHIYCFLTHIPYIAGMSSFSCVCQSNITLLPYNIMWRFCWCTTSAEAPNKCSFPPSDDSGAVLSCSALFYSVRFVSHIPLHPYCNLLSKQLYVSSFNTNHHVYKYGINILIAIN